jgi:cytoskeleton protein RodZ
MDSIGDRLRQARSQRGLSLDDVAARTRINRKYLEAIEKGDRSAIPGGFFYKSFVRQYASTLASGDSTLVQDIDDMLAAEEPLSSPEHEGDVLRVLAARPAMESPTVTSTGPVTTYVILLLVALAGSTGLYMWWHHAQQAEASVPAASAPQTKPASEPKPHAAAPEQHTTTTAAAAPAEQQPPQTAPASQPTSPTASEPAAQPTNTAPATATAPAVPGSAPIVLEITATDLTWFSVTADGKTVFADTLKPGESKSFAAQQGARLRIGNAGGLDIKFNGQAEPTVGPKGQVRTVMVTPSKFQVLQPVPEEE